MSQLEISSTKRTKIKKEVKKESVKSVLEEYNIISILSVMLASMLWAQGFKFGSRTSVECERNRLREREIQKWGKVCVLKNLFIFLFFFINQKSEGEFLRNFIFPLILFMDNQIRKKN